jgi:hypothetical protein
MLAFIVITLLASSSHVVALTNYTASFYPSVSNRRLRVADEKKTPQHGSLTSNSHRRLENSDSFHHSIKSTFCHISKEYHSSAVEKRWRDEIGQIADNSSEWLRGCARMRQDKKHVDQWMEAWRLWQLPSAEWKKSPIGREWISVESVSSESLSFFVIRDNCSETGQEHVQYVPIEPLMGFLRHPISHCFEKNLYVDKNYMFPDHASYIVPSIPHSSIPYFASNSNTKRPAYQRLLFDLGASLYHSGAGGASQSWFVDNYIKFGIDFDRIIGWEAAQMNPTQVFGDYPAQILSKITYFNVPCTTGPTDSMNPIRILKQLARTEDYVVFKIDIDNSEVELELINQILYDPSAYSLIDELYFEHHVSQNPMEYMGWGKGHKLNNLKESYDIFYKLRSVGIRAHSWV